MQLLHIMTSLRRISAPFGGASTGHYVVLYVFVKVDEEKSWLVDLDK